MADSLQPGFDEGRIDDPDLRAKYRALRDRLRGLDAVVVGYSGGVDSALLAGAARHALGRDRALACLAAGPSLAAREREEAASLAALMDVELAVYEGTEFANPAYLANGPDRCFHCKDDLFRHLARFAASRGGARLLYGANADDAADFRPGHRAAREHGALAPLAEAGLAKAEIRALARAFGLPVADKPAMPCLSSRIPYGSAVTPAKLAAVERGEALLRGMGFTEARLRHDGETARIEVPLGQLALLAAPGAAARLASAIKALGFRRVVADLEGFRSGSLNQDLTEDEKRRAAR